MATATALQTPNNATQLRMKMFSQPRCPDCAGPLVFGEGCTTCPICGFSHCN
jgi:uncharacterized Zn finger protein (UPF0148 family)